MIRGYTGLAVCGVAHAHTHADTRARTHAHTRTRAHTHTHALRIRGRSHWVIISHWTMFKDISSLCGAMLTVALLIVTPVLCPTDPEVCLQRDSRTGLKHVRRCSCTRKGAHAHFLALYVGVYCLST